MYQVIIIATLISAIYFGFKIIEINYIKKEKVVLKPILQEVLAILFCSIFGGFVFYSFENTFYELFNVITDNKHIVPKMTEVFTDEPGF